MAISLKEQLRILQEGVHYHAPNIPLKKSGAENPTIRRKATQMFYDFYAMELMHRQLGSPPADPEVHPGDEEDFDIEYPPEGTEINPNDEEDFAGGRKLKTARKLTRQQDARYRAAVQMGADPLAAGVANWADVELGNAYVPSQLRKIIDQVYSEVAIQLSNKLMAHLRGSILQEFQYMVDHASDWKSFRHKLISIYNAKGTVSKEDFDNAIKTKIPGMKNHPDAVVRLLKFCRYYQEMSPDPSDIVKKSGVDYPAPEPSMPKKKGGEIDLKTIDPRTELPEPDPTQPLPMPGEEPDDTDYTMPDVEIPPGADWDDDETDYSTDVEKEKTLHWLKTHQKLSEGLILEMNPPIINKVQKAAVKSGLTWNDIALGYNNLSWGGLIGGPRWGEGAKSLIKLVSHSKMHNIEEMVGIIDHIYDLQHNTGALLNKGGMYISPEDLDRRAKITHIARYLPHVSPLIKRLIIRVLGYVSKHPEIEKDITKVTNSPSQPVPPEIEAKLASYKFAKSYDGLKWTTQAPYENKKEQTIQNEYTAKYHTNGMYSVEDSMKADIQVFDTWEEFESWLKRMSPLFIKPVPGQDYYYPAHSKSEKEAYLEGHDKIKLDAEKEEQLKKCNMSWKYYKNRYEAWFIDGDVFEFYAFSDGSFMGCMQSTKTIGGVFTKWSDALEYCKAQTVDAVPLINPVGINTPVKQSVEFVLNQNEIYSFEILANKFLNVVVLPNVTTKKPSGMTWFRVTMDDGSVHDVLAVGKGSAMFGSYYAVKHVLIDGTSESWEFNNWNKTYNFIAANFKGLTQADSMVKGQTINPSEPTMFAQTANNPMPAHSPSKASYKMHLGINKPPTHTIRLTQEDENLLKSAGFEPKMQGSDVWYVNTKIGDVAKFYPNDIAKIMFVKTNKGVVVTKKIEDALTWLVSKYTGASSSPIVQPAQKGAVGSKAGAMYEKILNDAGFKWDAATNQYYNSSIPGDIRIFPFPKSMFINGATGENKVFNSLPELAMFVKKLGPPKL